MSFLCIKFHFHPASRYCVFFAKPNANYQCTSRFFAIISVCTFIASEKNQHHSLMLAKQKITVIFLQISREPNFDLEASDIFGIGKPMNRRFQRYTVRTEVLSTFHARVEYISVLKIHSLTPFKPMVANPPRKTSPSSWGTWTHIKYTHPSTDPTHHPKRHPDPISHFTDVVVQLNSVWVKFEGKGHSSKFAHT